MSFRKSFSSQAVLPLLAVAAFGFVLVAPIATSDGTRAENVHFRTALSDSGQAGSDDARVLIASMPPLA